MYSVGSHAKWIFRHTMWSSLKRIASAGGVTAILGVGEKCSVAASGVSEARGVVAQRIETEGGIGVVQGVVDESVRTTRRIASSIPLRWIRWCCGGGVLLFGRLRDLRLVPLVRPWRAEAVARAAAI